MGEMDTVHAVTPPLQTIFDAAKRFGLSDEEVWQTLNEAVCAAGEDGTVGECLDHLTAALAQRILSKQRRAAR